MSWDGTRESYYGCKKSNVPFFAAFGTDSQHVDSNTRLAAPSVLQVDNIPTPPLYRDQRSNLVRRSHLTVRRVLWVGQVCAYILVSAKKVSTQ